MADETQRERVALLPCPFCGSVPDAAFENLIDGGYDGSDDEITHCWTIQHGCPIMAAELWTQGATSAEAIAAWNTRAAISSDDVSEALRNALLQASGRLAQLGEDTDFIEQALARRNAAPKEPTK